MLDLNPVVSLEDVKKVGAILPSDRSLEPAITWVVQIDKIHEPRQIYQKVILFINRVELNQGKPAKYLPTTEQFEKAIEDLIEREILVVESGKIYHHPKIQAFLEQQAKTEAASSNQPKSFHESRTGSSLTKVNSTRRRTAEPSKKKKKKSFLNELRDL